MATWIYIVVTVLIAVVPEFGLFLWWASNLSARIKQLESDKDRLYNEVEGLNTINTKIAVMESKLDNATEMLMEIRQTLKDK